MPTGGKREGAGRPRGQRNKVTAGIRDIAQGYGAEAISALVEIMRDAKAPHAARVAASREIKDRVWSKSRQSMDHCNGIGSLMPNRIALVACDGDKEVHF